MGKSWNRKRGDAQAPQPPWRGSSQQQWSIWPGAWKSPRASWSQQYTEKEQRQFPAYDVAWKQAPGISVVRSDTTAPEGGGLVSVMQHAVNQARRVDQKLAKMRAEQLQKSQCWDKFRADVRQAVAREKGRYEADQKRMAQEIVELEEMQSAMYKQVTHVALESHSGKAPSLGIPEGCSHSMMDIDVGLEPSPTRDALELSDPDFAVELQRILGEAQKRGLHAAPFSTPPRRSSAPLPMTPPSTSLRAIPEDPYMIAPAAAHFGCGTVATTPPPTTTGIPLDAHGGSAARAADQESAGMEPNASPVSEKLRRKRQEVRQALAPFGLAHKAAHPPAPPGLTPGDTGGPVSHFLEDDDEEELDAATSPGFGKLE